MAPLPGTPRRRFQRRGNAYLSQATAASRGCRRTAPARAERIHARFRARRIPAAHQRRAPAPAGRAGEAASRSRHAEQSPGRAHPVAAPASAEVDAFECNLDPHYTFETFVEGKSNQLGKAAATQVANESGPRLQPAAAVRRHRSRQDASHARSGQPDALAQSRDEGDVPALGAIRARNDSTRCAPRAWTTSSGAFAPSMRC